jgi:hypothetical protein
MNFFTAIFLPLALVFCYSCLSAQYPPDKNNKTELEIYSELGYAIELDFSKFVSSGFSRKANNLMLNNDGRNFSAGIVSGPINKILYDYENGLIPQGHFNPVFILLEGYPVKINVIRDHYYFGLIRKIKYDELIFLQMRIDDDIIDDNIIDVFGHRRDYWLMDEITKKDFELLQNDSVYKEKVRQWLNKDSRRFDELDFSLFPGNNDQVLRGAFENGDKIFFLAEIYNPSYIRMDDERLLRINGLHDGGSSMPCLPLLYPFRPVYDLKIFSDKQSLFDYYQNNAEKYLRSYLESTDNKLFGYDFK